MLPRHFKGLIRIVEILRWFAVGKKKTTIKWLSTDNIRPTHFEWFFFRIIMQFTVLSDSWSWSETLMAEYLTKVISRWHIIVFCSLFITVFLIPLYSPDFQSTLPSVSNHDKIAVTRTHASLKALKMVKNIIRKYKTPGQMKVSPCAEKKNQDEWGSWERAFCNCRGQEKILFFSAATHLLSNTFLLLIHSFLLSFPVWLSCLFLRAVLFL